MMKRALLLLVATSFLWSNPLAAQENEASEQPPKEKSGDKPEIGFELRSGVTGNYSAASPNFYGIGALAEPLVKYGGLGAGLRIDGMALFGLNLGDDVQAGLRILAAVIPKVEYAFGPLPVKPVVGLAAGYYTVAILGASVANNNDDVGALAAGGQAFGFAPQVGIDLGGFRIAVLSHLVFGGAGLEPVFALELSGRTFRFP